MSDPAAHMVRMFSRVICGLCDEARDVILALRSELPFEYEEVFVDGDHDLERSYGLRVPVIEVNGQERFEVRVEPAALREALARPPTLRD